MIFADTNLVSEIVRPKPNPGVMAWIAAHEKHLHISTVVIAEVSFGIERIRPQERAKHLSSYLDELLQRFAERLHVFDEASALIYGHIMGLAQRKGQNMAPQDGMIAAIALRHKCPLATRNGKHFSIDGLEIIDPWA